MRTTVLLSLLLAGAAAAADPAPSIDEQLAKLRAAEKARADADKLVAEIRASLKAAFADIGKKLADAGVLDGPPAPPTPPPVPPPVPPADPLVADIRAAFRADGGKAADLQALAALYTLMVEECQKAEYATAAAVNDRYLAARDLMLKGALPGTRKRCGAEVSAVIGDDPDAPLTDARRADLRAVYAKLARAVAAAVTP